MTKIDGASLPHPHLVAQIIDYLAFLKCPESCDLNKNSWSNEQNKIATHWDSFVSIYYFTVFSTFSAKIMF